MADYSTMAISPVIGTMVSNDKGDFSNRVKCAGEQAWNNLKHNGANTALILGGAVATKKILQSPNATAKVVKLFDKGAKVVAKFAPKISEKLLKMPGKFKVLGLIAAPIAAAVTYIASKALYNMGQIDQKYTDKAKIEEATNKNLLA